MGKVLSVDTRIELVTVGKDGYALKIEDVASFDVRKARRNQETEINDYVR